MGRSNTGMIPGITPTPPPEYQANEIEVTYPCDPEGQPEACQRCHADCLSQFSGENLEFQFGKYCRDRCYGFDCNCCINSGMGPGYSPAESA